MDLFTKWKNAITSPQDFFPKVQKERYGEPLLFFFALYAVNIVLGIPLFIILFRQMAAASPSFSSGTLALILALWIFILGPVITLIYMFVMAAYFHLFAWLFGGSGYLSTFKALAYSGAPSVPFYLISQYLGLIPLAGPFIGILLNLAVFVYHVVLFCIGIRTLHRLSTGRAVAAVLIPYALLFLIIVIFIAFILLVVFSSLPELSASPFG